MFQPKQNLYKARDPIAGIIWTTRSRPGSVLSLVGYVRCYSIKF